VRGRDVWVMARRWGTANRVEHQVSVKIDFMWISCCVRMNEVEISVHVHFQGSGAICMGFTTECVFQNLMCRDVWEKWMASWNSYYYNTNPGRPSRDGLPASISILGDRHVTVSQDSFQH
jgi:hypothetical protein